MLSLEQQGHIYSIQRSFVEISTDSLAFIKTTGDLNSSPVKIISRRTYDERTKSEP